MEAAFERQTLPLQPGAGGRAKFTCLDVSPRLIVLGANTGSMYFCERESLRLVEMFTPKELPGGASRLRFSPNGKRVAVASQGCVVVVDCAFATVRDSARLLFKFTAHRDGTEVTALEWDSRGERVFTGDDQGHVYATQVPDTLAVAMLFGAAPQLLARAGSRVVQLCADPSSPLVVASDLTHCLLVEYLATPLPKATQLWAVSVSAARVEATIKFEVPGEADTRNLSRVVAFGENVLSWGADGVALLDVNVEKPRIVEWVSDLADPLDVAVLPQESLVYALSSQGKISFLSTKLMIFESASKQVLQTTQSLTQQFLSSPPNQQAPQTSATKIVEVIPTLPADPSDLLADLGALTELTVKALNTYNESGGTAPGLMPWLELWVRGASESRQALAVLSISAPVLPSVVTTCFEMKVRVPRSDAPAQGEWSESEALEFISVFGASLALKRASCSCGEWHYAEALKALMPLYEERQASLASTSSRDQMNLSASDARLLDVAQAISNSDVNNALSLLRKCDDLGLLLWALQKLAPLVSEHPKQTVLMLLDEYPEVKPWFVELAVKGTPVYVKYLNKLMEQAPKCRQDGDLVLQWFTALIQDSPLPRDKLFDADGSPAAKSDTVEWRQYNRLLGILQSGDYNTRCNMASIVQLCKEHGFWQGLLFVYHRAHDDVEVVRLAVDLDNWLSLEDSLRGCHGDRAVWHEAITRVMCRRSRPAAQASLSKLILLAVECLGAEEAALAPA
eukprot:m51a1_g10963 hypothetical protein (739) ;mRNA; r:223403-227521